MDLYPTTVIAIVVLSVLTYLYFRKRTNHPPGPPAFPLLGSLGVFRKLTKSPPDHVFAEAAREYGGVLSLWVGPQLIVVLNGYDTLRQALVQQAVDFNDRPNWIKVIAEGLENGKGLLFSNGQEWKVIRKFAMQALKQFGGTKPENEQRILNEVDELTRLLRESGDKAKDRSETWRYAISNIICSIALGQRFDYDDDIFCELLRHLDITINGKIFLNVTNYLPKLFHPLFPKHLEEQTERKAAINSIYELFADIIERHEANFDPNNIRDGIDLFIQVSKNESKFSNSEFFHRGNLSRLIFDLFLAGSETSSVALNWLFLYMIEYPDIQTKCRRSIQNQVGHRIVRLSDRPGLTYIEATIQEALRLGNVAPMGAPRTCIDHDIFINGYTIPKRTVIMTNLYSCHTDSKYWENPLKFNPDRFLDSNSRLVHREAFMPMGIGPRNCIGESLARIELFLMFSNLIQRFDFQHETCSARHDFSFDNTKTGTRRPAPYKLKVVSLL